MQEEKAPTVKKLFTQTAKLTGHISEIMALKFSPCGDYLATAGFDKQIFLWDIYNNCNNFAVLKKHTNAILDLHFSTDGHKLYSASADKSINVWDFASMKRYLFNFNFEFHINYIFYSIYSIIQYNTITF